MGRYQGKETGELGRLRELLDPPEAGDGALADKLFCSFESHATVIRLDLVYYMVYY